jgi:hypothetical protein
LYNFAKEIDPVADYFVCVDSCVLIDLFVEIIKTGTSPKGWDELKALVASGEAKLLVPEVTRIEFRKWVRKKLATLPKTTFKVQAPSNNPSFDAVINEQLTKALQTPLADWLAPKKKEWQADSEMVLNSLNDGEQIEFTEAISHRTKRRLIEELYFKRDKKPKPKNDEEEDEGFNHKRDQDCFIIDSLID